MHRHFRYIFNQLVGPLVVVIISLTGVIWLTQSLRFIDLIINKGLAFSMFLYLTVLLLPSLLAIILPFALFTATLYSYHRLMADSEIMVLRATGLSNLRLAAPALAMAGLVMTGGYAINLYLMPAGFHEFKSMQAQIRDSFASVLLQEGVFNTPIDGLTIYVRERERNGELRGILVHDNRDPLEPTTVMAERGLLARTDHGPRFMLMNGNRQQIEKEDGQLSLLYFESYAFDLGGVPGIDPDRFREAKERYLPDLFDPDDVQEEKHRREFLAEAHQRLVSPTQSLVFVLIALAALLSGEFNRRGQRWRLLIAIALAVTFQALFFSLTSVIVNAPVIAAALYLLVAASIAVAGYVLFADPNRRPTPTTAGSP
ncbi:MAG: LPS export ABC transporter permease LptF [Alphaproteobacteria bacterium]|jgi:lipopolysaccharide export system permease protein|nr:LPS export ABC transporter permease LptF [Alphaproteobacteria bacterium]|tara:strand:- start:610 stop:1722 length:1113 start_codon:yes stop_codon:yes gene_type:complete